MYIYVGVKKAKEELPGLIERTNTKMYDFLTPDALQRNLVKYGTVLAMKNDDYYSYKRGVVYFLLGRYNDAISDFDNSIKWSKSNDPYQAHYYRGLILSRLARYGEAVDAYTSALESFSESTDSPKTPVRDTMRSTKRAISRYSHGLTESLITRLHIKDSANVIEKQKRREQVEDTIDALFKLKIDKFDILNNRALANLSIGNYDQAICDLLKTEEAKHHYVFNLGYTYYYSGDWELAVVSFERAMEVFSTQEPGEEVPLDYFIYLACALERFGEKEEAEDLRKHILEREPKANVNPFHYKFLPDPVFMHVMSFLDHASLSHLGATCRTLNLMSRHESLYKTVYCTPVGEYQTRNYSDYFEMVKKYSKGVDTVYIDDPRQYGSAYFGLKNQSFKVIKVRSILGDLGSLLRENDCSQVEILHLEDSYASRKSPAVIPNYVGMKKLKSLVLRKCRFEIMDTILADCGSTLEHLEAKVAASTVLEHCHQLKQKNGTKDVWVLATVL